MIVSNENLFLIVLAIVWIVGAIFQDMKRREVDNIWNFSLIAFALSYRFAFSVFSENYWFFINGVLGLGIFLLIGNLFYYSRLFAGGDAKLLIALGCILPLSFEWVINFKIFGMFILIFMLGGSVYSILFSSFLVVGNFNRFSVVFSKYFRRNFRLFLFVLFFSLIWAIFSFFVGFAELIFISVVVLLFPLLLIFSKSVEDSCLIRAINPAKLTEGDWLYKKINVKGKTIYPHWEGISGSDLILIQNNYRGKVFVKYGIPFTPAFLIGFIGILVLGWMGWF